ncbi:ragulator complex protein LAMTOR1-like [Antechinus flavipes]|uniref:ragulator complex protein LAMTOR1-like n=1 Tax=Antechinus flavipes TaxID=38775 RepID=UPI002236A4AC|nr:ragulator complex protein LAMTOR1-like [Antechinus flavipes]
MGSCCCSCEEDDVSDPEEECARLLEPPSEPDGASISNSLNDQDEEAILKSILAKTASSIIDVAAAQSQRLGPHECLDRARLYHNRLAKLNRPSVSGGVRDGSCARDGSSCSRGTSRERLRSYWKKKEAPPAPLPTLTNHPHRVLADAQVPFADVQEAIHIAEDAHRAMQHASLSLGP